MNIARVPLKFLPALLLRGVFTIAAYLLYAAALQNIALNQAVVIYNTIPIFTAILAFIFLKELLNVLQILAMSAAFLGVVLVAMSGPSEAGKSLLWGLLLMGLTSLCCSGGFILNRMVNASMHWLTVPLYTGIVISLTMLIALALQPWLGAFHF